MIEWIKVDNYHLRCGDWTISRANNSLYPYALWLGNKPHGNFKSSDEAKAAHKKLLDNA